MSRGRIGRWALRLALLTAVVAAVGYALRRREDEEPWPLVASRPWADAPGPVPATPASPGPPPGPAPAPAAPAGDPVQALLALPRNELYRRAQRRGIEGRSRMSKRELAEALAAAGEHADGGR